MSESKKLVSLLVGCLVAVLFCGCSSESLTHQVDTHTEVHGPANDSSTPSIEGLMWKLKAAVTDDAMGRIDYLKETVLPQLEEVPWPNSSFRVFQTAGPRLQFADRLALWRDGRYWLHINGGGHPCLTVTSMSKVFGLRRTESDAPIPDMVRDAQVTTKERDGPNASQVYYRYYIRLDKSSVEYIDFTFANRLCAQHIDFQRRALDDAIRSGVVLQIAADLLENR